VTSAALALAWKAVRSGLEALIRLSCLLVDLLGCDPQFLDRSLLTAYGHPGVAEVGETMRALLTDMAPSGTRPLQEPYSIRCSPQLLGAASDALRYVEDVVRADLRSVSDNPLFFSTESKVVHGGT